MLLLLDHSENLSIRDTQIVSRHTIFPRHFLFTLKDKQNRKTKNEKRTRPGTPLYFPRTALFILLPPAVSYTEILRNKVTIGIAGIRMNMRKRERKSMVIGVAS